MLQNIVVGVDFSPASRLALSRAAEWSERLKVPLTALHVLQTPGPVLPEAQIILPDPSWLQDMENHARQQLESWIQGMSNAQAKVRWGAPAQELVEEAKPESLLVVAQVGHNALAQLLFGSTAARCVRHAPCDVLVVRADAGGKVK
jgi:nucleotide-binding universal stress UspA family protein